MSGADDLHAYYEQGEEVDRLDEPAGQVEFLRTTEVLSEHLPPAPAVVADVGGGPGRYALWLAGLGYDVHHRDLVPLHVEQLRAATAVAGSTPRSPTRGPSTCRTRRSTRCCCSGRCTTWPREPTGCRRWPRPGGWPGPAHSWWPR